VTSSAQSPSGETRATELFDLSGHVVVITGGGGLLGSRHAEAVASFGGTPVLADVKVEPAKNCAELIGRSFGVDAHAVGVDITDADSVQSLLDDVLRRFGRVDALINNAANNPKVEDAGSVPFARLENFPLSQWEADVAVGLTGAFLCSKILGGEMARRGRGAIVNISSEYGVIAPDQRLYRVDGLPESQQPVKPVSYTVVKAGLDGMTKYLATYWADKGVRVNTLTVGGIYNGQPDAFVARASERIPLGRMARVDEYRGAVVYLCSEASSFMTGANLIVDGGKSTW
jgi:NAD(P)-dependent dehydrogenase (short-subunit alcohol dehydrogenase family)